METAVKSGRRSTYRFNLSLCLGGELCACSYAEAEKGVSLGLRCHQPVDIDGPPSGHVARVARHPVPPEGTGHGATGTGRRPGDLTRHGGCESEPGRPVGRELVPRTLAKMFVQHLLNRVGVWLNKHVITVAASCA